MAGNTTATKEAIAVAAAALGAYVSIHTADPGTTGASEATGGSPAYARKLTTWTAGSSDGVDTGSAVTFDLPAGTYSYAGLWTSGGTYISGVAITSFTLSAQGQYVLTPTWTGV